MREPSKAQRIAQQIKERDEAKARAKERSQVSLEHESSTLPEPFWENHQVTPKMWVSVELTWHTRQEFKEEPVQIGYVYVPQTLTRLIHEGVMHSVRKESRFTDDELDAILRTGLSTTDIFLVYKEKATVIDIEGRLRTEFGKGFVLPVLVKKEHLLAEGLLKFPFGKMAYYAINVKGLAFTQMTITDIHFNRFTEAVKKAKDSK